MSIDDVTGSILKDGKAAVSTLGAIFGGVEKIAIAATGLYLICQKFPAVGKAVRETISGAVKAAAAASPTFARLIAYATALTAKLAMTDIGKRVGLALLAPVITKAFLLMAGGALIAAGAFAKFFLSRSRAASDLKSFADVEDLTTRAAQAIKLAAEAVRTPVEQIATAMSHIKKAQSEAATGSEEQEKNFKRLGYTLAQIKRMNAEQVFMELSQAMKDGKISVANYAALLGVMGRDAKDLIPAMKNGLAGLKQEFGKSGPIISRNVIDQLNDADANLQKLWTTAKGWAGWLASNSVAMSADISKLAFRTAMLFAGPMPSTWALNKFEGSATNVMLNNDEDFARSKEDTSRLQGRLNQAEGRAAAEKEELETLKKKNAEKEREVRLDEMSKTARQEALKAERAGLESQIAGTRNAIEREKLRDKLLDVQKEITRGKKDLNFQGEERHSDEFTKIGLYRGASSNASMAMLRQQITLQQQSLLVLSLHREQLAAAVRELQTVNLNLQLE